MYTKHEVEWKYKHRERDKNSDSVLAEEKVEKEEQEEITMEESVKLQAGARGIDVSENNGSVDWDAVIEADVEFAIIRLGYGRGHLDEEFYDNVQGALSRGLKIGVYYYSYALDTYAAAAEGEFLVETLKECGLTMDKLEMGVWFDMEDADGYKGERGVTDGYQLSEMCRAFLDVCRESGYDKCGVYASLSWLVDYLVVDIFGEGTLIWCAQWDDECDWEGAKIWQDCDDFEIDGRAFDGNVLMIP